MLSKLIKEMQAKGKITIEKCKLSELNKAVIRKNKEQAELERAIKILNDFARTMRPITSNLFTQTRPIEPLEEVDFGEARN